MGMGKLRLNLCFLMLILLKEFTAMTQGDIKSVKIGSQIWMAENLSVDHYRNGDPIPTGLSKAQWESTTKGAYAIYNDDSANEKIYGKLYNWYAVNDPRGLCPAGWHVPSDAELSSLETYLGGSDAAGGKMKSTSLWKTHNTGANNSSGFNVFPGGFRNYSGSYYDVGGIGKWWSSTEYDSGTAWSRILYYDYSNVTRFNLFNKLYGFSVRCVRD